MSNVLKALICIVLFVAGLTVSPLLALALPAVFMVGEYVIAD